jgi:hypothetical protein
MSFIERTILNIESISKFITKVEEKKKKKRGKAVDEVKEGSKYRRSQEVRSAPLRRNNSVFVGHRVEMLRFRRVVTVLER